MLFSLNYIRTGKRSLNSNDLSVLGEVEGRMKEEILSTTEKCAQIKSLLFIIHMITCI